MKKKKQFIVFGLGRFGMSIAKTLEENGISVSVVDSSEDKLEDVASFVTDAVRADLRDEDSYSLLGDTEYDGAVIAIGQDLEAATHAVMWASDNNIPTIIAKAGSDAYGRILSKLGANRVVYPERETGFHLAMGIINNNLLDAAELADGYSVEEIPVPKAWQGKSMKELGLRNKYGVNVIGLRTMNTFEMNVGADRKLTAKDILVMIGKASVLEQIKEIK